MYSRVAWVAIFILLDIVIGTGRSLLKKTWKSSVFRNGLYKKFSEIAIVAVAIVIDKYFYDVLNAQLNLYVATCSYVTIMEILSIVENFSLNGELSGIVETIKSLVKKGKGK